MKKRKLNNFVLGMSAIFLSIGFATTLTGKLTNDYRSQIDTLFGTSSYITNSDEVKYKSTYETGDQLMEAAKNLAIKEGAEGTVIMKNDNSVLPLEKTKKIALFGGASYMPYMSAAGNSDQVLLKQAIEDAGFSIDTSISNIYDKSLAEFVTESGGWGGTTKRYVNAPNKSAGDYTNFKVNELTFDKLVSKGFASANWKDSVTADVGIVTFSRPGGEGTTYKPGSALDSDDKPTGKNPLALSDEELAVVKSAKETCDKVVVLLNTSCTLEIGALLSGEFAVDGIAYIGIPNDYQLRGTVKVLSGEVNATGALADTYATSSTSSPGMVNFGGDYYKDYTIVADFEDTRWPGVEIENTSAGSFGGTKTYNGGTYVNEVEGIYTGYNYYETRYYDGVANASSNALSSAGISQGGTSWDYAKEVSYPFGYGLSYLDYTTKLTSVSVEDRVGGKVTANVALTNNSNKDGLFRAELFVQTPYTDYDKENAVEKSAIQFLNSKKVDVKAGQTVNTTIEIATKYLASYDYTKAKSYIMDAGTYYFSLGNGSHEALNNVMQAQGLTPDKAGEITNVKTWVKSGETDTKTYAVSDSGALISNVADNADMNYYLPGSTTYLSRKDWKGTYPINYNAEENVLSLSDSPKKDEWLKELRNQQYTVKTTDEVENFDGTSGPTFSSDEIGYEEINNIKDEYWEKLVDAIPAEEALGAVAHGGSQSDELTNIKNPVVKQYDGPIGFNGKNLATNNGESAEVDRYFVDPESEAGKFKANINSQTLLGSAFNPELAYEWGAVLGNTGLWIASYQIWAAGLNYHRTPYNGRNTEYHSEDPMLTNVIGREIIKGTKEFGIIVGPKHIGFNDQEHNRAGVSVYMNEQKFRETDLRGFQGAIEDAGALGLMVAFNRIGAINASHHVGMLKELIRGEWNFNGLISTDMMNNAYYFNPEGCTMATVTQMADFAGNNSHLNLGTGGNDATWTYLNPEVLKKDQTLVDASREAMKYQLYAFANSALLNVSTLFVTPSWEVALNAINITTYVLGALCLFSWATLSALSFKKETK